jgi:hypothetical protein
MWAAAASALPSDIAGAPEVGLQGWYRANGNVTVDGSNLVSQWDDASNSARNATQGTSTLQPVLVPGALNGQPVIRFDGTDDILPLPDATLPTGNSSYTVFCVVKAGVLDANHHGFLSGGTQNNGEFNGFRFEGSPATNTILNTWWGNDLLSDENEVLANTPYCVDFTYDSSSGRVIRKFGSSVATNASTTRNGTAENNLIGKTCCSEFWDGDIAEIIIYSRALTSAERTSIEGYLSAKYNIGMDTSASPSVAAGATGTYVLGSTGSSVTFTVGSTAAGSLSATEFNTDAGSGGFSGSATSNDGSTITPSRYSAARYWQIDQSGLSGFDYSVSLDITGLPGIVNADKLVILKRVNGSANPWVPVNTTRIGNSLHASGLTSFSEFAIGSDLTNLPVSMSAYHLE